MNSFQHNCFILREIPLQNKLDAGMDTASTQFHDRLAALEQENIILRLRLQSCECSDAVLQAEVARYRQHKQARQKLASQEAITDPVSIRCSFLEHHWLETTAEVARVLLTLSPLDAAVNTALQIIGEALDTNRSSKQRSR